MLKTPSEKKQNKTPQTTKRINIQSKKNEEILKEMVVLMTWKKIPLSGRLNKETPGKIKSNSSQEGGGMGKKKKKKKKESIPKQCLKFGR